MGHCSKIKSMGPLIIRLALGAVFLAHGGQKVLGLWGGSGLQVTVENFVNMGSPAWVGYSVALGELLGGIGLIVGCLTRLAALGIAVIMGGAIHLVHWQNGFFLNHHLVTGQGHGIEFAMVLLAMAVSLIFTGGGALSIDGLFFCRKHKEAGITPAESTSASSGASPE